jgi:hypothetical protein
MRKWLIRISLSLVILIAAGDCHRAGGALVAAAQADCSLQQIEKELGLRITCDSLSTGWLGKSELTNVSLGLPLSTTDFLKVKR